MTKTILFESRYYVDLMLIPPTITIELSEIWLLDYWYNPLVQDLLLNIIYWADRFITGQFVTDFAKSILWLCICYHMVMGNSCPYIQLLVSVFLH